MNSEYQTLRLLALNLVHAYFGLLILQVSIRLQSYWHCLLSNLKNFNLELHIPVFEPTPYDDFIRLKVALTSDEGIISAQFRGMFGECEGCNRFMLMRGRDLHRCPGKHLLPKLMQEEQLFFSLDSIAGGEGLTRNQFRYLFPTCIICGLIFIRTVAHRHSHVDDSTSDSD